MRAKNSEERNEKNNGIDLSVYLPLHGLEGRNMHPTPSTYFNKYYITGLQSSMQIHKPMQEGFD